MQATTGQEMGQEIKEKHTVKIPMGEVEKLASGLSTLFFRLDYDSQPGNTSLTITGLPAGTSVVSVWMTEWKPPNNSHIGDAYFFTSSVQLSTDGTACRVYYNLRWGSTLPTGVQMIFR